MLKSAYKNHTFCPVRGCRRNSAAESAPPTGHEQGQLPKMCSNFPEAGEVDCGSVTPCSWGHMAALGKRTQPGFLEIKRPPFFSFVPARSLNSQSG